MIYKNQPAAYARTMDDDAGTMSSWLVLVSAGIFPACIGEPVYYLNVPLFETVDWELPNGRQFHEQVENPGDRNVYIQQVWLNGKQLDRNFITQEEITQGGTLKIIAGATPNEQQGIKNKWVSK